MRDEPKLRRESQRVTRQTLQRIKHDEPPMKYARPRRLPQNEIVRPENKPLTTPNDGGQPTEQKRMQTLEHALNEKHGHGPKPRRNVGARTNNDVKWSADDKRNHDVIRKKSDDDETKSVGGRTNGDGKRSDLAHGGKEEIVTKR